MSSILGDQVGSRLEEAGKCRSFIVFLELSRVFLVRVALIILDVFFR